MLHTHLIPVFLASLLVAGCGPKTVPAEALAQIPSERVDQLAGIQDQLVTTEERLEDVESDLKRAKNRTAEAEDTVKALSKQRDSAQQREVDAIQAGNSAVAAAEDSSVKALDEQLTDARAVAESRRDVQIELEHEVDMLSDKIAWLDARLESERAIAAVDGGAAIEARPFERRESKLYERYQDAHEEWVATLEPEDEREHGLDVGDQDMESDDGTTDAAD